METWFTKNCPRQDEMLKAVATFYEGVVSIEQEPEGVDIREADSAVLEIIAKSLGYLVGRENSLADYISQKSTLPSDPTRWYVICCAAAWLIMQIYVRNLANAPKGGE